MTCQTFPDAVLGRCSLKKFVNEKIFQQAGDCLISIDGVILNLRQLLRETATRNLYDLILKLYKEQDCDFPSILRGSFTGFIYFKNENKLVLFTDHISSRPIFYFYDKMSSMLVFGPNLVTVSKIVDEMEYDFQLNVEAAYCLLTFGHMLGDLTLKEGIRKVPPGSTLIYTDSGLSIRQYHRLSNQPVVSDNEGDLLCELVKRFRTAILYEYNKDLEYGYKHIATLSGGLDSRTNVAFAKRNGFEDITCITYSQSNYLDHKIAEKISHENKFNFAFFPLDWGSHLVKCMDDVVHINGGLVSYVGICNLLSVLGKLRLEEYGLLHTGLMGGEIFGEYIPYSPRLKYESLRYFMYGDASAELLGQISHLIDKELSMYESVELFKFYNMGVNAQLMNLNVINQFIDMTSAHLFLDVLDYVLRIPANLRNNKKLYAKMINVYIPEFAKYTWEHYLVPPKYPLHSLKGYDFLLSLFRNWISKLSPSYSMNPFEYWYRKNSFLRRGIEKAFSSNINSLETHSELKDDCVNVFERGNFYEKAAVVTLLKALGILGLNKISA